jgi:hypothetical protein
MPSEHVVAARFEKIANQMMKGCNAQLLNRSKIAPDDVMEAFRERYKDVIAWVDEQMPPRINGGVMGVVGKAALWYGRDKVRGFCERLKRLEFTGPLDPCHCLWAWLLSAPGKDTTAAYRRAVSAMRAYIDGRDVNSRGSLTPCRDDIFEWDQTYTIMRRSRVNQTHIVWEERRVGSEEVAFVKEPLPPAAKAKQRKSCPQE